MKLSKETRFYYLDYLQKKLNQKVRGQELSLSALDNMLYMIMELKKKISKHQSQPNKLTFWRFRVDFFYVLNHTVFSYVYS